MKDSDVTMPTPELIAAAIDRRDDSEAKRLLGFLVADFQRNKEYSINWIASLLSFIGRRLGESAVEEALRDFGERYLRARRAGSSGIDARRRMEGIARAMKANGSSVSLTEDSEKYILSFHCGTGGALIDSDAYTDARSYLELHGPSPVTFGRSSLPVYCAHCSVNNEMQPIEWDGVPSTLEFPPSGPGEACVHHVYKDASQIPHEMYERIGKRKPR